MNSEDEKWAKQVHANDTPERVRQFIDLNDFVVQARCWWDRKPTTSLLWCPYWWRHQEAERRLDILWRAYEDITIRRDYMQTLYWFQQLDYTMRHITDPHGCFRACIHGHVDEEESALECVWPPYDWYAAHRADLENTATTTGGGHSENGGK